MLHADIVDLAYQEDSNHRRIHTSEISPEDCFYGFGEKSGEWNKAQKYMCMSPKDAMGYNPKETDSLYKHIPFLLNSTAAPERRWGISTIIRLSVILTWGVRKVITGTCTAVTGLTRAILTCSLLQVQPYAKS